MAEEIQSPPYPGEGLTADGVFNHLRLLRKWITMYRDDLNTAAGQDLIPEVIRLPEKSTYTTAQPVLFQVQHLLFMRRLREGWDHLVRTFEDAWDCQHCQRQRAMLVQSAAVMLNNAFTPYELREARARKELERMQRYFERLYEVFGQNLEPDQHEEDQEG